MARPIKETPVLTGKDAERFVARMRAAEEAARRMTPDEKARVRQQLAEAMSKFKVVDTGPTLLCPGPLVDTDMEPRFQTLAPMTSVEPPTQED